MAVCPQGDVHLASMELQQAIDCYTTELENASYSNAQRAILLCQRSLAHAAFGTGASFAASAADGLLAVEIAPCEPVAYLRAGSALRSLRQFSRAEKLLRDGLAISTDSEPFSIALEELAKMRSLENEVETSTAAAAVAEAVEVDRFRQLEEWLLSGSARGACGTSSFPALYMRTYEDSASNRGVHCRVDIPPETEIMAIGRDFLITVEMGMETPIGRKMSAAGNLNLSATKHCYLAVFVLYDMLNSDSFFQPYYRILPSVCAFFCEHATLLFPRCDLASRCRHSRICLFFGPTKNYVFLRALTS